MQQAALKLWAKDMKGNYAAAQKTVYERARDNGLAALGKWNGDRSHRWMNKAAPASRRRLLRYLFPPPCPAGAWEPHGRPRRNNMRLAAITMAVATVLVAGGCNRIGGGGAEAGKAASLDFDKPVSGEITRAAASTSMTAAITSSTRSSWKTGIWSA